MLRDRSDVTWRTRTEVEAVLASLQDTESPPAPAPEAPASGRPMPASGPVPVSSPSGFMQGPTPPPGPPGYGRAQPGGGSDRPPNRSGRWLLIGGGIAAAVIAVIAVVAVVALSGDDPKPTPSAAVDSADLTSILLSAEEIESIAGRSDLAATDVLDHSDDTVWTMSNPNCAGVMGTALEAVYAGSGYTHVRDQAFTLETPRIWIAQTAVLFPSADQANDFAESSADKWGRCVGETVTLEGGDTNQRWTFSELTRDSGHLAQGATEEGGGGYACEHVIRVVSNVVVEAVACDGDGSGEADLIAEELVANVPT